MIHITVQHINKGAPKKSSQATGKIWFEKHGQSAVFFLVIYSQFIEQDMQPVTVVAFVWTLFTVFDTVLLLAAHSQFICLVSTVSIVNW